MPNWSQVLDQVQAYPREHPDRANFAFDDIRRQYLAQLHEETGRNVIAYYSGFLSKPNVAGLDINDQDKNGFMVAVHQLDRSLGLDLILHTPGGDIAATQSIVDYLHQMFGKDIRAIVPQIAMSAGTMVACSCKSIVMGKESNIGPIDPQLRDIPAYGVIAEFKRARAEILKNPSAALAWQAILGQIRPSFLGQCQNSIRWSNQFVRDQLEHGMFEGERDAREKAARVVRALTEQRVNRSHARHIHFEECARIGLVVEPLEASDRMQDLVLTVHHCYMQTLANTPATKVIENHRGTAMVNQAATPIQFPFPFIPPAQGPPQPAP